MEIDSQTPDTGDARVVRLPRSFGTSSRAWRALAWLGCLGLCALAAVPGYQLVQDRLTPDYRYQLHAFAVPAQPVVERTWPVQVDEFANQVSQAFGVRQTTAQEFSGWILEASERHELEPELIASLVLTESSFRKSVRSHVGALGPAQVRPEMWGRFCGASDLTDPAENIYCGAQVLAHLRDICGDNTCALKAYNVGRYSKRHDAANRYVAKIDARVDQLEALQARQAQLLDNLPDDAPLDVEAL